MNFLNKIVSEKWKLPFLVTFGVLFGLVIMVMYTSNFFSYFSDSPKTCMNCHVMGPQYASWEHSSHRENATCSDCHVPHDNIFKTYYFKAKDGMGHATAFTMRTEPQAIMIKEEGKQAVQMNCKRCHANVVNGLRKMAKNSINSNNGKGRLCWDCHQLTPHGKARSLSSAPFAKVPTTESVVPNWLKEAMRKEKQQ